ncbi:hypothetical protein JH26_10340 [Microvirga sp. BSC39]|nr:hypothetical protein JH26_10340 [Microvirga sp. BSC39]
MRGLAVPRHDVVAERLDGGSRDGEEALEIRKGANIHIRHVDLMTSKSAARGGSDGARKICLGFWILSFLQEQIS